MKHENYDLTFPDQPVVDLYLPIWAKLPAFRRKPAFIWSGEDCNPSGAASLTYEDLNTSVQSISSLFLQSLERGDTVLILCGPGLELVEIIFACQRAGLLAVAMTPPTFPDGDHSHLVRVISQTRPKAAIATSGYINCVGRFTSVHNNRISTLLRSLRWIATEGLKGQKLDNGKNNNIGPRYNGCRTEDVYLIQYTSGTTGIPKPVLVTAGAAAHNVRVARKAYDLHPNSIIVSWLPQYHDCGLMFLLLTIVSGATCVLTSPDAFINRPRLWLELITEYKATCTPVPSFALPLVVRRGGADKGAGPVRLGSLKNLIIVNEPIYKAPTEEFIGAFRPFGLNPASISPSYGLAENCTFVSTAWRSEDSGDLPTHNGLLPSAKLDETTLEEEIKILVVNEETHEPVEDGTEGEIWILSPSNCNGYLGHPSLTRDVFNARLRNRVAGCFVRTGDRGVVLTRERYLYVTGKCSDIIRTANGEEIHAHCIERSAYNSCPKLLRPGCLAAFELSGSIALVAELQALVAEPSVLSKVCQGIRNSVGMEVIGLVVLVKKGSVPKTTSGKLQRWAARIKLERGEMDVIMRMEFGGDEAKSGLKGGDILAAMDRSVALLSSL